MRHKACPTCTCDPVRCSVEDCDGIRSARGWCPKHYERWRIHGDPMIVYRSGTQILESEYKVKPRDYKAEYARTLERMK